MNYLKPEENKQLAGAKNGSSLHKKKVN